MISKELLRLLVCPLTKTELVYDVDAQELISEKTGLAFPIRNNIPIMLIEDARIIDEEKAKLFISRAEP